jgi:hypothetical protein
MKDKYGQWACVLGAAEGLGAAFSMGLARRGFQLILVDKNQVDLSKTSEKVRQTHQRETVEIVQDLANKESLTPILNAIAEKECRFLVYNAAYGPVKPFLSNSETELDLYLDVNVKTTLHLIYRFIKLHEGKPMGILLLSSLAGFRGTRLVIPYAATKAFLWNLAEGLHYEFQEQNLDISVCCPGTINTLNFQSTGPRLPFFAPKPMDPEKVAEEALQKFGKSLFIIPGLANKFSHFLLNRVLPRRWASSIHNKTMKKMYTKLYSL